jgi:hypothetical protein
VQALASVVATALLACVVVLLATRQCERVVEAALPFCASLLALGCLRLTCFSVCALTVFVCLLGVRAHFRLFVCADERLVSLLPLLLVLSISAIPVALPVMFTVLALFMDSIKL